MSAASAETGRLPRGVIYVLIAVAASGPLLLGWFTGDHDLVRRLAETPVVVGLVAFVVKMLLDANELAQERTAARHREERDDEQRRHEAERAALTQQLEHAFAIGSSSHMANVAFDKHVKFCEEYAEELRNTLASLLDFNRHREAYEQAKKLTDLRRQQALWLTPQMEEPLEKIERALRWIGGGHMIADDPKMPEAHRDEVREKVSKLFIEVLGVDSLGPPPDGEELDDDLAISNVVRGLGRVLGVDDLTRLRQKILSNAATFTAKP